MAQRVRIGLLFALVIGLWLTGQAAANAAPLAVQTTRLYGATRIETAIKVSQAGWQRAAEVLLARADDYPDSLVAIPLSRKLDAPILLTYSNRLDPQVLAEIQRLGARHVVILGGEGVMGAPITKVLDQAGITWERLGGADRFATAAEIADKVGGNGQVILASGEDFPDALAIGPYAGVTQTPILLSAAAGIPVATRTELSKLQAANISGSAQTIVVGGEGVIPSATLQGLPGINRLGGQNRYETAAKIYLFSEDKLPGVPQDGSSRNKAYMVTGEDFPDGLVVGALAAKQAAPLFLSSGASLPAITYSAMGNAAENSLLVTMIGGPAVLSDQVKGIIEGKIQPPYLLGGWTVVVDPGHGGPDTGAIGATGTFEKTANLAIGLDLADYLRSAGAQVVLTRSSDVSPAGSNYSHSSAVPDLQARTDIANNAKGTLFISIHNNSASNQAAYGTETYYSSQTYDGQPNPQAALALRLARAVQSEVVQQLHSYNRGPLEDRGVKDEGLFVTDGHANMPAILVEAGFLSNPAEEKLLSAPAFQQQAALGIYRGVLVYRGY